MLPHHDFRGLTRSFCGDFSVDRSQVHLTSAAVNGLPSCHLTPSRSLKVSTVLSSVHVQLVPSSGTIVAILFCATCWSSNTTVIGSADGETSTTGVDSARIGIHQEMLPDGMHRNAAI